MIGIGNTLTADLIVHDLDGDDIADRTDYYNGLYQRTFEYVISRYRDTYPIFGNPWVIIGLLGWDHVANHAGMATLAVANKFTDLGFMMSVDDDLDRLFRLSINMHKLFREWNELERKPRSPGISTLFPVQAEAIFRLVEKFDDDSLREELRHQVRNSEAMAVAIFRRAVSAAPEQPPADRPVNPYAVGLNPATWEADGLFEEPGMTAAQADEIVAGIDVIWDDTVQPPPIAIPGAPVGTAASVGEHGG
jgi:hypothetical protein